MTNHEAAILRLEREVSQLARRIGALERARTPAAEQSALAQWYDPASTWGAPTVPFGGCTAVPTVLTARDSKYGPFTLNYDPASGTFVGCKVVAFPGAGRCPALAAIAVRHVLVNRGTYGAAELTAAAIEGAKRGDVVGERTFGGGSVQKTIDLPDGAALLLTVAKYEGPDGKKIQDEAVVPTVQVGQNVDEDQEESPAKGDEPLNKALQLLKAKS